MLNGLDLFSGIGGIALALEPWVRVRAYCEIDRYCQAVLLQQMSLGYLSMAPIWDDVRTLHSGLLPSVDIITGGFPCQDISCAGNGRGLEGERSGLFFEIVRLVGELRPRFVFLENVPAITTRGLERVCLEFATLGYDCRWTIVSAESVGAPHLRERWFLLAHSMRDGRGIQQRGGIRSGREDKADTIYNGEQKPMANPESKRRGKTRKLRPNEQKKRSSRSSQVMADPNGVGCTQGRLPSGTQQEYTEIIQSGRMENTKRVGLEESRNGGIQGWQADSITDPGWWAVEPALDRVVNGLPHRVDRIKGLGNAVVPLQAQVAFKRLMGL